MVLGKRELIEISYEGSFSLKAATGEIKSWSG
jgi:hypothetical protein